MDGKAVVKQMFPDRVPYHFRYLDEGDLNTRCCFYCKHSYLESNISRSTDEEGTPDIEYEERCDKNKISLAYDGPMNVVCNYFCPEKELEEKEIDLMDCNNDCCDCSKESEEKDVVEDVKDEDIIKNLEAKIEKMNVLAEIVSVYNNVSPNVKKYIDENKIEAALYAFLFMDKSITEKKLLRKIQQNEKEE